MPDRGRVSIPRGRATRLAAVLLALASLAAPLAAQRPRGIGRPRAARAGRRGRGCRCVTELDLHAAYASGTTSSLRSWGGGLGVRTTYGRPWDAVQLVVVPGLDYVRQQGGAGLTTAALDLDVEPGGWRAVTPYAGASAGANWASGGSWVGARLGLGVQAGVLATLGASRWRLKAEERFGYVNGQEHALATRVGVLWSP